MAEAFDGLPNGLMGQPPGSEFLLEDDRGQEVQRPGTAGLPEAAWGRMEDAFEGFGLGLVEDRLGILGSAFSLVQAAWAFGLEGVEGVPDGSDGAAEACRDLGRSLPVGAGQQDLGPAEGECLSTSETGLKCLTLRIRECSNEKGWFHDPLFGTTTPWTSNRMRLH